MNYSPKAVAFGVSQSRWRQRGSPSVPDRWQPLLHVLKVVTFPSAAGHRSSSPPEAPGSSSVSTTSHLAASFTSAPWSPCVIFTDYCLCFGGRILPVRRDRLHPSARPARHADRRF